jgi:hypothetical protein
MEKFKNLFIAFFVVIFTSCYTPSYLIVVDKDYNVKKVIEIKRPTKDYLKNNPSLIEGIPEYHYYIK